MKRSLLVIAFFALTTLGQAGELDVSTRWENLFWDVGRENTTAGRTWDATDLFWNVEASVTQEFGDGLTFVGGWEADPVLRWRGYARLAMGLENLSLAFTPFLGTFNSTQKWFNPGLEARIGYTWPGLVFAEGGFSTTFAPVAKTGDYYLSEQSASVGVLAENGIVTFSVDGKEATFQESSALTTVDARFTALLDTEMYLKNFPLRWALSLGYEKSTRSWLGATERTASLHSGLVGGRLVWDLSSGLSLWTEARGSILTVGWDATILDNAPETPLYQWTAGVHYHW